jgi:hypothetical protein
MEKEINPEIQKDTELIFIYTPDSEISRVQYTIGKKKFYDDNYSRRSFELPLPEGSTMDGLSADYEDVVRKELEPDRAKEIQEQLERDFEDNYQTIKKYFESNGFKMPESFQIRLTKYGTGGSYSLEPLGMTINISRNRNFLDTLIHELTHTAMEQRIFEAGLNQHEKESIIDYLMIENSEISSLAPRQYQFGRPSEELLKKVGLK